MKKWKNRGIRVERELARKLWSKGFAVVRGPASGARAKHIYYPDLVAFYRGRIFIFEVKYTSRSNNVILRTSQLKKLREFKNRSGGEVYVAVKQPGHDWVLVDLNSIEYTDDKKYVNIKLENSISLDYFINTVTNIAIGKYIRRRDN